MKNFKSLCLLTLILTTLIGCSEKSKTPTDFNMTLGGLSAIAASDFAGGIILTGSNGSENFKVGVTPDKVNSFSIELPEGNWNFTAIGWLNEISEGMMSGQARCGFASSKIESSDTTISMTLSQANCTEGKIATTASIDTTLGTGLWFKRLNLISCLNPNGITAGDLCNGPELNRLPGEAAAVRVVFPGNSNFESSVTSLRSQCYSHQAVSSGDFSSGLIPTQLRLPSLGTQKFPWAIETFSDVNCQEYETTYKLTDGLTGTQGVYRMVYDAPTDLIALNFADNFVGRVGSLFEDGSLTGILPDFTCGNNCYDSTTLSPSSFLGGAKDEIREQIWQELGSIKSLDSNDIVEGSRATATITDTDVGSAAEVTVFAPLGTGSAGNNITFSIIDSLGIGTISVSCDELGVNVQYDSAQNHTDFEIAEAINNSGSCSMQGYEAQATTAGTVVTTDGMNQSTNLSGGITITTPTRREKGNIPSIRRMLYGPIGIGLKLYGITTFNNLCDGSMDGVYEFNIPAGRVRMHLTDPSPSAIMPQFATYATTVFERKIAVEVDGEIEEAFYFNCTTPDQAVGAHLTYKYENSSYTVKQTYWDTTTAGDEWLETASQEVNSDTNELLRQSLFMVKIVDVTANWDAWLMRYHHSNDETDKVVGRYESGTLFTQKTSLNDGHLDYNDPGFSLQVSDQTWNVATDSRNGTDAAYAPNTPPAPLETFSNVYPSYKASDFEVMMNGFFWDYSF